MLAGRFGLEQVIVAPSKLLVTFSMVRVVVAFNILAIVSLLNVKIELETEMEVGLLPTCVTDQTVCC